jgi:hypothetical protein
LIECTVRQWSMQGGWAKSSCRARSVLLCTSIFCDAFGLVPGLPVLFLAGGTAVPRDTTLPAPFHGAASSALDATLTARAVKVLDFDDFGWHW